MAISATKSGTDFVQLPGLPKIGEGQSASTGQSASESSTFFQNPQLAGALSNLLGGTATEAGGSYMDFIKDPTSHPIFNSALNGLFGALEPSENAARMNLGDTFRASGNTASSTFADKAVGLEGEFMRNRGSIASNLLTTLFPQVTDALYKPMGQIPSLLDATKLQQANAASTTNSATVQRKPEATGGMSMNPAAHPTFEPGGPFGVPGTIKYGAPSSMTMER